MTEPGLQVPLTAPSSGCCVGQGAVVSAAAPLGVQWMLPVKCSVPSLWLSLWRDSPLRALHLSQVVAQPVLYLPQAPQAALVMIHPLKIPLQLPVLLPRRSASAEGEGRKLGRDKPHWRLVTTAGSHVCEGWTKPPQLDMSHDRRLKCPFLCVPENKLPSLGKFSGPARLCYLPGSIQAALGGKSCYTLSSPGLILWDLIWDRWRRTDFSHDCSSSARLWVHRDSCLCLLLLPVWRFPSMLAGGQWVPWVWDRGWRSPMAADLSPSPGMGHWEVARGGLAGGLPCRG